MAPRMHSVNLCTAAFHDTAYMWSSSAGATSMLDVIGNGAEFVSAHPSALDFHPLGFDPPPSCSPLNASLREFCALDKPAPSQPAFHDSDHETSSALAGGYATSPESSSSESGVPSLDATGQASALNFDWIGGCNYRLSNEVRGLAISDGHADILTQLEVGILDSAMRALHSAPRLEVNGSSNPYEFQDDQDALLDGFSPERTLNGPGNRLSEWSYVPNLEGLTIAGNGQLGPQAEVPIQLTPHDPEVDGVYLDAQSTHSSAQSGTPALGDISSFSSDESQVQGSSGGHSSKVTTRAKGKRVRTISLRSLGLRPTKTDVDNWVNRYVARCRKQSKGYGCPACRKISRRPSALKIHLYHRYRVLVHKCTKDCGDAFSTKANMERHAEKCTGASKRRPEGDWEPRCGGKEDDELSE
ncbi:hypothetical protein FS749_014507 [Ceratobasidium sp. UAMH 11750]|nr:hypothetical protein FS749_014507 [Ceratobasidium sp. UAMH 11750]